MEGAESIKRRFKADKKKILAEQERRLNIKPELPGVESEPAFDFKINDPTSTSDDTTEQSGIFSRMKIWQVRIRLFSNDLIVQMQALLL